MGNHEIMILLSHIICDNSPIITNLYKRDYYYPLLLLHISVPEACKSSDSLTWISGIIIMFNMLFSSKS